MRQVLEIDIALLAWLNAGPDSPVWLVRAARFLSREMPPLLLAGLVGAWMVGGREVRAQIVTCVVAVVLAWAMAKLGQQLIPAERPFVRGAAKAWITHNGGSGFPSTHATVAFAVACVVARTGASPWAVASAWLLASAIAWSRLCLGVHYPSDIVAAGFVGLVAALSAMRLVTIMSPLQTRAATTLAHWTSGNRGRVPLPARNATGDDR